MSHPISRVRSFEIVADYTLKVRFYDNSESVIHFQPILRGELCGPLQDLELFNLVRIETLVWPIEPISIPRFSAIGRKMSRRSNSS